MVGDKLQEIFDIIKETIAEKHTELEHNQQLTNEMIVDDLMLGLGYNKKRDTGVKRIFDKSVDWEIKQNDDIKIAVKVNGLTDKVTSAEDIDKNTIDYCINNDVSVLIVTSGDTITVCLPVAEDDNVEIIYSVDINNALSETDLKVISALSKDGFDLEYIKSLSGNIDMTEEDVKKFFIENKSIIANYIENLVNTTVDNCKNTKEQVEGLIDKIVEWLSNESETDNDDMMLKLRNKVEELTAKNNEDVTTIKSLQITVEELNEKIKEASGESRSKALELLSLIDDSDTAKRSYVAVINDEIIQFDELHTFVGKVLQTLYSIKSFEAQPFIFNGDVFTLESDENSIKHNDIIINNRAYDVIITNNQEDEVLQKLRTIFAHFDDILFEVKKIGNLITEQHTGISDELIEMDEVEETESIEKEDDDIIGIGAEQQEEKSSLLAVQLKAIDSLLWTHEDVNIKNIKFIGSNIVTFVINDNTADEISLEQMLAKSIDAVISISESEQGKQTVIKLKQKNLELISDFIKPYSDEYKDCIRINGTKFVITKVKDVKQLLCMLSDVCTTLDIDTESIFVYLDAVTSSEEIESDYGFDEDKVPIINSTLYNCEDSTDVDTAILRGDMFNNVLISKNSLQIHKDIIKKALAVKTKYMSRLIDVSNKEEELKQIVSAMLTEADRQDKDILKCNTGYVIGEQYKLLSDDIEDVGDNPIEVKINDNIYYLANLEDWQIAESLIKLHIGLFNNASIALKVQVDIGAIRYYGNEFVTSEPSTSLAIQSFVRYVASCIDTKSRKQ